MARPIKKGLSYFSFDVTFFQDIKIRKLVKYYGAEAVSIYQILLCRIYSVGYYLEWDDELPFIIYEISGLQEDRVTEIIDYCLKVGLFDKGMYDTHHVLTSRSIQERYVQACGLTKRKQPTAMLYSLLSDPQLILESHISSEINNISSEETKDNTEETAINTEKTQQIKENKRKDNNSLRSSLSFPPSSTTTSTAHDDEILEGRGDGPITAADAVEILKADQKWLQQMQRRHSISIADIVRWLSSFVVECGCRGKEEHVSMSDFMQHFNDWLFKQKKLSKATGTKPRKSTPSVKEPLKCWQKCLVDLCNSVSSDVSRQSFELMSFESYSEEGGLLIRIPSREVYERIEENVELLNRLLQKHFGSCVTLKYRILPSQ